MPETGQAAGAPTLRTVAVVPARYDSRRLPGKVLAPIAGRSMLERVWRQTARARAVERVVIATDDERVRQAALTFAPEADVIMTAADLASGSDRVAEVASRVTAGIYVNVQADMPLLDPVLVDAAVAVLEENEGLGIATAAVPINDAGELADPDLVKVTIGADGCALGFFRTPRAEAGDTASDSNTAYHHVGIYAFRRQALLRFAELGASPLEHTERLEQLRALENGIAIGVATLDIAGHLSVDSAEKLEAARQALGGRDG